MDDSQTMKQHLLVGQFESRMKTLGTFFILLANASKNGGTGKFPIFHGR